MPSHLFHLLDTKPQQMREGGFRIDANSGNMSVLKGMAASFLHLEEKQFREPHWHPNAYEMSYCLEGNGLMTIFNPGADHETFTIEPGVIIFVPMGSIHHIENTGKGPLKMLLCFNHENPEDLNLSSSLGVMSNLVLGSTFSLASSFFEGLPKSVNPVFINKQKEVTSTTIQEVTNRFKFNLEKIHPQIQTKGGWVKLSNSFLMPTLQGLATYSLYLDTKGVREPHWHPNASELNYVITGKVKITLLTPSETVDTFEMKPGDISFMPQGYLHHIENIGSEPAHLAVFFNNATPSDIGLSGCLGAYSNNILASLFNVPVSYFDPLPKYQEDLFVVGGG